MNRQQNICQFFNAQASNFDEAAIVQTAIGQRLFERLELLTIQPKWVLDLGCGTGIFSKMLKKKYPKAMIVGIDIASNMLKFAQKKQSFLKKWPLVRASMDSLPFPNQMFDLVFANQIFYWSDDVKKVLNEINRVMNACGCLMFSTLGPDTLKEIKADCGPCDVDTSFNKFIDMHDIGDFLLNEHFVDPVVDMEMLTFRYKSSEQCAKSLKTLGFNMPDVFERHLVTSDKISLTYEAVYGHAWKGETRSVSTGTETYISIADITKKQKGS